LRERGRNFRPSRDDDERHAPLELLAVVDELALEAGAAAVLALELAAGRAVALLRG
jgi:hypothetical protein